MDSAVRLVWSPRGATPEAFQITNTPDCIFHR
jgi:hypothetical protein